jgi:hypothetical protein
VTPAWTPPPPPAHALERASRPIVTELRREARNRALASLATIAMGAPALILLARSRSGSSSDWVIAAVLWVLAFATAAAARRVPSLAMGVAAGAMAAAAWGAGGPGALHVALGIECVATELAIGAAAVGAVWLALRSGTTSPARAAIAAAAAAGALGAGAALQVTCAAAGSAPHALAFHLGGVALAAAAASLLPRRQTGTAA